MSNPYFIDEPANISFSGGRTSAYMLYRILEAHKGKLPDEVKVTFANTGKEMPETLDFVQACADNWGVEIVWLERHAYLNENWVDDGKRDPKNPKILFDLREVTHETASRNGEPFEKLIKCRGYLPNPTQRFCTTHMKIRAIQYWMRANVQYDYLGCIGIRADEQRRAIKLHGKVEAGQEAHLPLWLDGVTKYDVFDFWSSNDFDLQLENNNGTTDWGNCDICFLKGGGKRLSIMKQRPDLAEWWISMEDLLKTKGGSTAVFRRDQPNYETMLNIAQGQGDLFDNTEFDDETIPCFCGD